MTWWKNLLGIDDEPTPTVKDALDAAAAANDSTHRSTRAVQDYWARQRRDARDASDRLMDEYERADQDRTRNSRK